LFSAVMVTRMFIALWVARKRPKTLAL